MDLLYLWKALCLNNNTCGLNVNTHVHVYYLIKYINNNLKQNDMKTVISGIDQTTGAKVTEELFVNDNSAIENLVNYFLQGKGTQLYLIEQREKNNALLDKGRKQKKAFL